MIIIILLSFFFFFFYQLRIRPLCDRPGRNFSSAISLPQQQQQQQRRTSRLDTSYIFACTQVHFWVKFHVLIFTTSIKHGVTRTRLITAACVYPKALIKNNRKIKARYGFIFYDYYSFV